MTGVTLDLRTCAIVGAGRLGSALAAVLPDVGGPFGRGFDGAGYSVVILAVPDREITRAAEAIAPGPMVGHCSGATTLDALAPHEGFGLHPLMTFGGPATDRSPFEGAGAAIAGTTERALHTARVLATALGMEPFEIADEDRAAYHAAASIASNFLVTIEDAAEVLLATTGNKRHLLLPLIRMTLENWAAAGRAALTGPIARGDHETVARQRAAIADRTPDLLPLFDTLADRTTQITHD